MWVVRQCLEVPGIALGIGGGGGGARAGGSSAPLSSPLLGGVGGLLL